MNDTTKPYHHGDLRRVLLETALEMMGEDNGWQFTLRELARRASVSHTASYKHFPDKAALLAELALIGFERLTVTLLDARPSPPATMRDEFVEMSRAYVQFGASNPNLYRLMFNAEARQSMNTRLQERAAASLDILTDLITRGQNEGWLRNREVRKQAAASWSQLHGLVLLTIDGMLGPDTVGADVSDAAVEVLLEGLETAK